jgi:hypothetical protein
MAGLHPATQKGGAIRLDGRLLAGHGETMSVQSGKVLDARK